MAAPNPYLIYIELLWPDGTLPNQNQIARVNAYDVNGAVVTWEGQSGFNPGTGGWFPVYMQNIAAFSPPRDQPNLRFEVVNTAEVIVHTTQVFDAIPNESTVRITIGVGAVLVGGGSTPSWQVSGHVKRENGTPVTPGTVIAFDVTNGSTAQLGTATIAADGAYSITYAQASFANNGVPHAQPNLQVKAFDSMGQLLATSSVVMGASTAQVIELTVPDSVPGTTQHRVFGNVKNSLGLAVSGISVQAFNVAWTATGLQETLFGTVTSGAAGAYEIFYQPPSVAGGSNPCGTPAGEVNLIVYAKDATSQAILFTSPVLFNARREERVDPVVDRIAVGASSEYQRLHAAISTCLGTTDAERLETLNKLNTRPELLKFVVESSGQNEAFIRAYVSAWLIATEINAKVPVGPTGLSRPMAPEVIYGLLRVLRKQNLQEVLNVPPDAFFDAIVRAVHQGIVSPSLEADLFPNPTFGNKSLLDDWRVVLARLMNALVSPGQQGAWQGPLLELVFPSIIEFPQVPSLTQTLFGTDTTGHNVVMPSGIVAGDLLIVLFTNDGSATVTTPSGWTQLFSSVNGTAVRLSGYKRLAVGTESGTNVNFVTSAAEQAAAQIYVIAKDRWSGLIGDVAVGTATTGTSVNVDPPSLTTPWASTKTLWIACAGHDREFALSSSPANYTNSFRSNSSTAMGNATGLSARRELQNASDNPGNFVIASAEEWVAQTIAIKPSPVFVPSPKKELVVGAYFDNQGSLPAALASLVASSGITQPEADNVAFVFEMYETASRYFPIVAAVYPRKATMGWQTIRDLASVPVELSSGSDHWVAYAFNSLSFSNGQFPGDIQGASNDDKGRVYARRLQELFGGIGAQQLFSSDLTVAAGSDPTLVPVGAFLAAHPTFSLETTNVDRFLSQNGITLPDADVTKIKQVQRVYRIAPNFSAASALIVKGLDSVVKITGVSEGQFIADNEEAVGGLTVARNIYRTASHYSSEIFSTLVKFHHNLNDLGGLSAIPGPVDFTVLDPTEGLLPAGAITAGGAEDTRRFPNWVALFGDLNQCACKHCQTVLSPGAYLVDLLEFCDGTPGRTLFNRRPDLEQIELTCANTERTLPYIDLVNEILEALVTPLSFVVPALTPSVQQAFDAASIGDAGAINQVRLMLIGKGFPAERIIVKKAAGDKPLLNPPVREWVIEDEAWRFSVRHTVPGFVGWTVHPAPQTSSTNDSLEVFPEHFNRNAYNLLSVAVFPFNLPLALGREEVEIFLKAKNVRPHEVREAFSLLDPPSKLKNHTIALTYLRLTSSEAAAILGEARPVWELWGFSSNATLPVPPGGPDPLFHEDAILPRPDKPTETVRGDWEDLLTLMPVFLHRSGLRYEELVELLDTEFVQVQSEATHGVHVAAPAAQLVQCNINEFQIAHLSEPTLFRMSLFIRLWRRLGWKMREVDRYLMALEGGNPPATDPEGTSFASKFVRLSQVKRLVDDLKLAPRTIAAFWKPIETRRSARNMKSLFDEVFLDGDSTQPEIEHLDSVARGTPFDLTTQQPDEDIKAHVRMALRLKAADIDLLWETFVETGAGLMLDVSKLTDIYRVASLSGALKISVENYFDLSALTETTPLPVGTPADLRAAILETHAALTEFRIARSVKISSSELLYLLADQHDEGDSFVPRRQDLEAAVRRLAAAAGEIAATNPEQPDPDAVILSAGLAKVMPADKVLRAVTLIEEGAVSAENQAFVDRYFIVFLGTASTTFLASLAALGTDTSARRSFAWDLLHAHLLEQAKTTTAVAVAAELVRTDEDTANTLLTLSLGSLRVPQLASALDDWKVLVIGGWSRLPVPAGGPQPLPNPLEGVPEAAILDVGPGMRASTLVVPKGAEYRFVASVASANVAGTTVSLVITVDGEEIELTPAPGTPVQDRTHFVFAPITLRAGGVHAIRFIFDGVPEDLVSFLWRLDNADPVLVPTTVVVPFAERVYLKLYKATRLAKGLALTKPELERLIDTIVLPSTSLPDALPLDGSSPRVPWRFLSEFLEILGLNRSIRLNTTTLFELWRDQVSGSQTVADPADLVVKMIAAQTDWKAEDIVAVLGLFGSTLPFWDDPELWRVLRACFVVIRRLDIRASLINQKLVIGQPTIGTAVMLRNVFRTQFSKDAWKDVFKPLRDPLRRRQRDALVGYLTTRPVTNPTGGPTLNFFDANDLFSFLLIDVEMEPDTLISRIKLALNSVQLFVHRVFLGLEDARVFAKLAEAKDQWTWMERFRVWEANRKIFLFPENWIEPELRDDKTDFFKEFEEELSQGTLTHETAVAALTSYLDKMREVSNLEIVGSVAEGPTSTGTNFTLHVVGRTRTQVRTFYYRTFEARQGHDGFWAPWQEIPLEIGADVVAPIVVDGRLHVFWMKVVTRERTTEAEDENEDAEPVTRYQAEIRLMWSEYLPKKKKWTKPKVSKSHGVDMSAPPPIQREIGQDVPDTDSYHLRMQVLPNHVAVALIKTEIPKSSTQTVQRTAIVPVQRRETQRERVARRMFTDDPPPIDMVPMLVDVQVPSTLDPVSLGTFRIYHSGEDRFEPNRAGMQALIDALERAFASGEPTVAEPVSAGAGGILGAALSAISGGFGFGAGAGGSTSSGGILGSIGGAIEPVIDVIPEPPSTPSAPSILGANLPIGTVLKANAAHEVGFAVNSQVARDALEFTGSIPFFHRTPGSPFRLFETNFNYVRDTAPEPFFYETNLRSLFALVKSVTTERRTAGGSGTLDLGPLGEITFPITLSEQRVVRAAFSTFHHPLVQVFEKQLHDFGVEGLMNRLTQALPVVDNRQSGNYYYNYYGYLYLGYHIARDEEAWGTTQRMFESEHRPEPHAVAGPYPLPTVEFAYGTSFGVYNWELFFHAPMLVAERLKQDFKFEDALRWYHYVFDPKQTLNTYERTRRYFELLPRGSRYWNFLPFFANRDATDSLLETLGLKETATPYERNELSGLIDEWKRNPFRPHLVARSRTVAYQKHVVMKYLDNLIAWADDLFRQDTFETINEATQLYVLADEILGQRPDHVEPLTGSPRHTYRELKTMGLDDFSNAVVEVESLLVGNRPHFHIPRALGALGMPVLPPPHSGIALARSTAMRSFFFRIPRNERLDRYWGIVQDRLFKIRNSMNIDGVKRQLALFEPPIDPALLVRAVAAGLDLGAVISQLGRPLPHYRFNVWIQKATELTKELQSFGAAFLAALEKRDAEDLALLRQGHEIRMLQLVRTVRQQQIREAEGNVRALELSRELAEERRNEFRRRSRISSQEQSQIDKTRAAIPWDIASGAAHALASIFALIPDSKTGTAGLPSPLAVADIPIGKAATEITRAFGTVASTVANVLRGEAALAGLRAGFDRRWEDWKFQERLAQKEMTQIDQQIAVANIRLAIAEKELENHDIQIEQAEEMREFLRDKFTSRELYHWMVGELSRAYQSVYKLAYDTAKTAERTFGFELGVDDPAFIQFDYRDSLREGLLAGEKLLLDLKRLDVAYLERNKRELEIQKSISLAVINGDELQTLRETGSCEFELPEVLFDLDFPGQYFRRIKGVRLTIPCVTGPHTSVSATLSLVGSNFRKEATIGDVNDYPFQGADDTRFAHDPVSIQSIATGTAQGDPGLFEFNFRDERYLPFEGAGAVSRWRLELPTATRQFDYNTISDVVVQMSYTARQAGGLLKLGAEQAIEAGLNRILRILAEDEAETGLVRAFSLKKEFPDVFHHLLSSAPDTPITITLLPEHFPFVLRDAPAELSVLTQSGGPSDPVDVHVLKKLGADPIAGELSLNGSPFAPVSVTAEQRQSTITLPKGDSTFMAGWGSEEWTLMKRGELTADKVEDLVLVVKYIVDLPPPPSP